MQKFDKKLTEKNFNNQPLHFQQSVEKNAGDSEIYEPIICIMKRNSSHNVSRQNSVSKQIKNRKPSANNQQNEYRSLKNNKSTSKCKNSTFTTNINSSRQTLRNLRNQGIKNIKFTVSPQKQKNKQRQYIYIQQEQLKKFTKKFAIDKADLEQKISDLTIKLQQKTAVIQTLQNRQLKLYEENKILKQMNVKAKSDYQKAILCLEGKHKEDIRVSNQILSSLRYQLIQKQIKYDQEQLEVKRCREFLKIKEEIICRLQRQLNQATIFNRNRHISVSNQKINMHKTISLQLNHNFSEQKLINPTICQSTSKNKKLVIKKSQKNTDRSLEKKSDRKLLKKVSITDLKDCNQEIQTKIQGLIAAVRDRDIEIQSLKQETHRQIEYFLTRGKPQQQDKLGEQRGIFAQVFQD